MDMSPQAVSAARKLSLRHHLIGGFALVVLLAGGLGGWAANAQLAGAVIAGGSIVVDSSAKKVQHPTGGVIGAIRIREGDRVKAGDVLVSLDETQTRVALTIVTDSLDELNVRQARLLAERDGAAQIAFPAELLARAKDAQLLSTMAGETALFEARRQTRLGQKAQLRERIVQLEEEVKGLAAQSQAKQKARAIVAEELIGLSELRLRDLVPVTRINELQRTAAQLEGEFGQLTAQIASANGKSAEISLQLLQIDQELRGEVGKELADIRAKTAELTQHKVEAEDRLKRVDIRAPQDGTVHELSVHTEGGVIQAGETLMLVVPSDSELAIEARVNPNEIDRVRQGQAVTLRFSAFDQRSTPVINGEVSRVSPDIIEDKRTGAPYYAVRVSVSEAELARLGTARLIPGMPVEAFIRTGERSALSYFLKPLTDQMSRAFRDS